MTIRKVGVVGCGLMGSGIAQVAAMSGYETIVSDVSEEILQKGFRRIEESLSKFVEKGTISAEQKQETLARLKRTLRMEDYADCDIVVEAIIENIQAKKELFARLDQVCKSEAILASNTSSISIVEMATVLTSQRRRQFLGLHFFNPVPLMKLVEVIPSLFTDEEVVARAMEFARRLGKTPVRAKDRVGFIANRLLVPYLLDAVRALEEGVGSIEDIDAAMKLGCNHPMGPFTLLDFVGLDTTYYIALIMYEEYKDPRFAPPPLLKQMVLAGWHGRKTGRGFYDYSDPKNPTPMALR
jgi:3-hydroxybutyryl-CoA dehydrogenase